MKPHSLATFTTRDTWAAKTKPKHIHNPEKTHTLKYNYSMIDKEKLTYDDMSDEEIRKKIVDKVKEFNDFFCQLCDDIHVVDRFLVDNKSLLRFKELVSKDLDHHLINGWNFVNKNSDDKNGSDPIEDTVFFYPIIGSIRDNLIENL